MSDFLLTMFRVISMFFGILESIGIDGNSVMKWVVDQVFSTYAKFSEKLTFLTP